MTYTVFLTIETSSEKIARRFPNGRIVHASEGAGTELKKILSRLRIEPKPGCKCNRHILAMNVYGTQWCKENIDTIIGWLREEAQRSKYHFLQSGAKILIKRAILNSEIKTRKILQS